MVSILASVSRCACVLPLRSMACELETALRAPITGLYEEQAKTVLGEGVGGGRRRGEKSVAHRHTRFGKETGTQTQETDVRLCLISVRGVRACVSMAVLVYLLVFLRLLL